MAKLTFDFSQFSWDGPVFQIFADGSQIFIRFSPSFDYFISFNPWLSHATCLRDEKWHLPLRNHCQRGVTFGMGRFFWLILSKISTLALSVEENCFFIRFFALFFISWVSFESFKCKRMEFQ